jgi:tRNA pseudouridine32 synthase/23S rRNA pseudouridine746 synthase
MRDGVGPSCVAVPDGAWPSMLDFLVQRFPQQPRELWAARMRQGDVVDEHGHVVHADRAFEPRLRLYYYRSIASEARIPFDETVLHQDEHLVVVDKPHFLPVVPSGRYLQETVLVRVKRALGIDTLVPLHRIDRDTAGLVILSVQPRTRGTYHALFREHRIRKIYEAIARWRPDLSLPLTRESRIEVSAHFMQQREVAGPPNARTHVRLLGSPQHGWARYELEPVTGHRHQLRVHMHALGLPILGDGIYPELTPEGSTDYAHPLQLLAKSVAFTDPISGAARHFDSARRLDLPRVCLNSRGPDHSPS